ncbi:hypothetical protein [Actinocrispum wychmicini]|uniref:Uncharacterized protein n=1 Tax=Actinocrispum wychmicini TaxID=1213861 RepID=A0A4R2IR42_9PSEU|nr:hypothetical protein [Actinocrispum wychmicini]TCO45245.1 hypothetical protein EV192_1219 [Actinocrispum wychmicini]
MTTRLSIGWLASLTLVQAAAATWVLSRQPTLVASSPQGGNVAVHSHLADSSPRYAPPISAERWPYLVGVAFLAAHILFVLVTACAYGSLNILRRREKPTASTGVKLLVAGLMGLTAAAVTPVVAWISMGAQPTATVLAEATDVAGYTFAASVLFIAVFGMPWDEGVRPIPTCEGTRCSIGENS